MEYVIVGMLGVLIILQVGNLFKKKNDTETVERLGKLELGMVKEIGEFKVSFANDIRKDFDTLVEKIDRKLTEINMRVTERLDQSLEKTNKTFANAFGTNSGVFDIQHKMSNGFIADALLYAPAPLGTIAIDSKFPLENYERMTNKKLTHEERVAAEKQFKVDFRKHIDAISSKYIIPGETAGEAIMFLPAEAIFAEVNAYHTDILNYAYAKKVWITSPTTLMSTLTVIEMILKNMERDKYAKIIHDELNKLAVEFDRYKERWDKLARNINTVSKSVEELNTTSEKISRRFDSINKVEVDKLMHDEEKVLVHN